MSSLSSSEDEGCQGSPHVFYKDKPEWKDVVPIPPDEGPVPVVSIDYSKEFADVYDFIRGVMQSGELSSRVLQLTNDAINLNIANYTVWQLRRDVLQALGVPKLVDELGLDQEFEKEFSFCGRMIEDNPKNYQVWHHQKILVTWALGYDEIGKTMEVTDKERQKVIFRRELNLTKDILGLDAKNYHAWQHRQWILAIFGDFSEELEYINSLLLADVRNNSAWNQRYFVFCNLRDFSYETVHRELDEIWKNFVKVALANESPWSYLRGILKLSGDSRMALQKEVIHRCKHILREPDINFSIPMLGLYIELVDDLLSSGDEELDTYSEIVVLLEKLAETIDPIRGSYWEYIKKKFVSDHSEKLSSRVNVDENKDKMS